MERPHPVYADNAATTQLDKTALEAMRPWLSGEYGNASQPYSFARAAKKALRQARETVASCLGAAPEEIFFTSGGTESDNWVIKGAAFSDPEKRLTLTSAFEHHAVLHSCAAIERLNYPVAYLRPTPDGRVTPQILETAIGDTTRLVSIMFANNEIGSVLPIWELCEIAHAHGALFHTDAVQAVGHVKIDVHELGVDFLSASAHKFNGPKGIGFLYIRREAELPPYMDGGAQESGRRAGTENVASIVGMATALRLNCAAIEDNRRHILNMERQLTALLDEARIPYVRNGGDHTLPGLISLSFPGADGEAILHRMDLMGISVSTGSACNGASSEISHVLRAIGLDENLARGTVRISLGKDNTGEDVERIAGALKKILGR
ncbi:MAG: cysteine desulfurase [Synergistaceae bacterium]|nr:cysteine desulfurase [Synergistaceae bacterium]